MLKTKKKFEEHLNRLSPEQGSDKWIIGGKIRMLFMWKEKYGSAIRKYDPKMFDVQYNNWSREK